jgi:hypothetical protein
LERRDQRHAILLKGHALNDDETGTCEGSVVHALPTKTTSATSASSLETKSNRFLESDDGVGVHNKGFIRSEFLICVREEAGEKSIRTF